MLSMNCLVQCGMCDMYGLFCVVCCVVWDWLCVVYCLLIMMGCNVCYNVGCGVL